MANNKRVKKEERPSIYTPRTFGQKAADGLTKWAGSWVFIIIFLLAVAGWIALNGYYIFKIQNLEPFDPFPFILLNLGLSLLAAIQAPIILMSQNRHAEKDRIRVEYDYAVNRKAEREIQEIKNLILDLKRIKKH